jgi:hypothetical protein
MAERWSDDSVFSNRAHFILDKHPAQLGVDRIKEEDAGIYRCRVDFQIGQTRNSKVNLTVIGKSAIVRDSRRCIGSASDLNRRVARVTRGAFCSGSPSRDRKEGCRVSGNLDRLLDRRMTRDRSETPGRESLLRANCVPSIREFTRFGDFPGLDLRGRSPRRGGQHFSRLALAVLLAAESPPPQEGSLFRVTEANCNLAGTCRCI